MSTPDQMGYDSGDDFLLEYGDLQYTFNEIDFTERCEQAAKQLGIAIGDLNDEEKEDLINFVASNNKSGITWKSALGPHLMKLESNPDRYAAFVDKMHGRKDSVLPTHWLRRLVFRQAWVDRRIMIGEIGVLFDEETSEYKYTNPSGELIELQPCPNFTPFQKK